jgi:hypothetical protein
MILFWKLIFPYFFNCKGYMVSNGTAANFQDIKGGKYGLSEFFIKELA